MMKRRILVVSGLFVLFLLFCFNAGADAGQYKVKKGENLYTISKKFGVSVAEIKKTNHLTGNRLKPGQVLSVKQKGSASPALVKSKSQTTASYKVKKGDTLITISRKTGVPAKQIAALNNIKSKKLRAGRILILTKVKPSAPAASMGDEDEELSGEEEDLSSPEAASDTAGEAKSSEELLGKWGSVDER
jgi:peptidoglycan endopeptidase LytE